MCYAFAQRWFWGQTVLCLDRKFSEGKDRQFVFPCLSRDGLETHLEVFEITYPCFYHVGVYEWA